MSFTTKALATAFTTLALSGCATLHETDTTSCVLKKGSSFSLLFVSFSNRDDQDNEECRASRAATMIANMRKKDGSPDIELYAFAANLYEQSSPTVKAFMDKMFKEQGMSIEQVRFDIKKAKGDVTCERVTKEDGTAGFKCVKPK